MIKREDFNGKTYDEMLTAIQADLAEYNNTVGAFATVDECVAEEQVLMASMDEIQQRLDEVTYELPANVEYDGKKYSKKDVTAKIIYMLNKLEVKWEQTLGLYQLVTMWKSEDFKQIPYRVYDSTLRCLNQVSFKGLQEWTDILVINAYLAQCHNEYSLDTGALLYLSECHNVVMDSMKALDPALNVPEQMN
jgi:hypothetical protein